MLHICMLRKYDSVNLSDWFCFIKFLSFKNLHRKKSRGLKSGDRGVHSTCSPYPQILFQNIVDKTVRCFRTLCAGAQSWWNHVLDKSCKGTKSSKKSDCAPCNISAYFSDVKTPSNINKPTKLSFRYTLTNALDAGLVLWYADFVETNIMKIYDTLSFKLTFFVP